MLILAPYKSQVA